MWVKGWAERIREDMVRVEMGAFNNDGPIEYSLLSTAVAGILVFIFAGSGAGH